MPARAALLGSAASQETAMPPSVCVTGQGDDAVREPTTRWEFS